MLLAATALLLAGCGIRSGYPNHAPTPSLVEPGTSPHDNRDVYLQLIRKMQQQGAYYASLAHIDAYRLRYGDPPELRILQADALRETGQDAEAASIYRGLLHGDQAAPAWHGLGLIDASERQYAQAGRALQHAVELDPIDAAYLSDLGYARLCAGQLAAAHEPLAKAAQLAPGNITAVSNLALWALLDGEPRQADDIMRGARLPQATRDAIRRLAARLDTVSTTATASRTRSPPRATPHRVAVPAEFSGIPGGVLQRFGTTTSTEGASP